MYSTDKSGFKQFLANFYKQIKESEKILKKSRITIHPEKVRNILYLGMGGSAIAGNLLYDILFDELKVPLDVVRGYSSPSYCNKNTLVIVSSYSGNTEETLSAAESALAGKPQFLAVTSGGKLQELANSKKWSLIKIPQGFPPRQALGYLFFPLYHVLGQSNLIQNYRKDLNKLAKLVGNIATRNDETAAGTHVLAQELAKMIKTKIPIIYSSAPHLQTVSRRWQNQIQENSKSMAFANVLPEMNHNEIVGYEQDLILTDKFIVIFLKEENPQSRIEKRIELTEKLIRNREIEIVEIFALGKTRLERAFSLIILGDWVSYYLALYYKKDPIMIKNIDFLKSELAKA